MLDILAQLGDPLLTLLTLLSWTLMILQVHGLVLWLCEYMVHQSYRH